MKNTIKQALFWAIEKFKKSSIPTPHLDAELLLAHVLKRSREYLLAHPEQKIPDLQIKNYKLKIVRRCLAEPIAYITGHKEFYGLDFNVNKNVLIPRPETEILVERALEYLRSYERSGVCIVADIGTGSGNIIVSLADKLRAPLTAGWQEYSKFKIDFFATEISPKALRVAKKNARTHGVEENITFINGRYLNPLLQNAEFLGNTMKAKEALAGNCHFLILANLPYLSKKIYNSASDSVRNFEPKNALLSGLDGLDDYRKLLNQVKILTKFHGFWTTVMFEISPEQKALATKLIKSTFPRVRMKFYQDLAGKYRVARFEI